MARRTNGYPAATSRSPQSANDRAVEVLQPGRAVTESAYDDVKKSAGMAYAFWFFLGGLGAHRF
jgi:hypothetical protein